MEFFYNVALFTKMKTSTSEQNVLVYYEYNSVTTGREIEVV
jgi:hypothetical protein